MRINPLATVCILLVSVIVQAGTISVATRRGVEADVPAVVRIKEGAPATAVFSGEEISWLSETGRPQIPWRVFNVLLPPNADLSTVTCTAESALYGAVGGFWEVSPAPPIATCTPAGRPEILWPEGRRFEDGYDLDVYQTDAFWPGLQPRLVSTGKLRQWWLAEIAVPLAQYNPVTGRLKELVRVNVVVDFARRGRPEQILRNFKGRGRARVAKLAANFRQASADYNSASEPEQTIEGDATADSGTIAPAGLDSTGYTILTTSAIQSASNKLDDFVTHKQSRGWDVQVVTDSEWNGGSGAAAATNIRTWLQNNYVADDILYVLLIGDPDPSDGDVAMMMDNDESPTDFHYSDLTGGDRYWEVLVGRIPYYGVTSDLDHILQKTIDFQNSSDTNWRRNALMPMVPLDDTTFAYEAAEDTKGDILEPDAIPSVRIYDDTYGVVPPPEYLRAEAYPADVWADGAYGMIIWQTHGWSQGASGIISTGDVSGLNDAFPGTTWQGSCQNGWPEESNNLAYAILKNGGIATHGATRNSYYYVGETDYTSSTSSGGLGYQYAKRIVQGKTVGLALADTRQDMVPGIWKNFVRYNLYGDPEIVMLPTKPAFTITPTDEFYITTVKGQPPASSSRYYTLENNSGAALNWTASEDCDWLEISQTGGTINAGDSTTVILSLASAADDLSVGTHTATVTFTDATNSITLQRKVRLIIEQDVLFAWWKLDETSGATAADATGAGFGGTLVDMNDTDWVGGHFGNALDFDGVNDYVELPALNLDTNTVTLSAWVRRTAVVNGWAGIIHSRAGSTCAGLNFGNTNELRYHWNGASNTWSWNPGLIVPQDTWTFTALVVEPAAATIYMNSGSGFQSATNNVSHDPEAFDDITCIGRDYGFDERFFNGRMDDVRVYNHSLDSADVQAVFLGGKPENPNPPDEAVGVPTNPTLSWLETAAATQYNIFLGTDQTAIDSATTASPEYQGSTTACSYDDVDLAAVTDYYWRVDAVTAAGTAEGTVWSFTTGGSLQVGIDNHSFELPGTTKQNGWTNVPDWSSDTSAANSGVETGYTPTHGLWTAFVYGSDPAVWQLTDHVLEGAQEFTLKVDARSTSSGYNLRMKLYYDDAGTRNTLAVKNVTLADYMQQYSLSFDSDDVQAGLGNRIGIEFDNTGSGWLGLDNVRLTYIIFNDPPFFYEDSFVEPGIREGFDYTGSIADRASDPDPGDTLTFSKAEGNSWLNIDPDGTLSGVPGDADVGLNEFIVQVDDDRGGSDQAVMQITVVNMYTGQLGTADFAGLASYWQVDDCVYVPGCEQADLNFDNSINTIDLGKLADNWLTGPTP